MVDKQMIIPSSIEKYVDEVVCDVVPMEETHLLLGRSWQYYRNVTHDDLSNKYFFLFKGQNVALTPLSPREVSEDQVKMKIKREQERKKEERKQEWKIKIPKKARKKVVKVKNKRVVKTFS